MNRLNIDVRKKTECDNMRRHVYYSGQYKKLNITYFGYILFLRIFPMIFN